MRTLLAEAKFALRGLLRNPAFSAVAVLTLALGIGANTAIFSVLNALLLHPAGIPHPDHVVAVRVKYDKLNLRSIGVSAPDFADVRDSRQVFPAAAAISEADYNYSGGEWPERLQGAQVSWQWFDVFEVKPLLGRVFRPEEDQPKANQEVILAHHTWMRLFGADPTIIGRTIQLNLQSYKVVGVMGPDFNWPNQADLWTPLGLSPADLAPDNRFNESYFAVARVASGKTFAQARSFVDLLTQRDIHNDPHGSYAKSSGWGIFVVPLTDFVFGDLRLPLLILLGAVGFVLLIACSNVAGLALAKASAHARELGIRAALGASRWQLVRRALVESLLISLAGVVAGLLISVAGIHGLLRLAPAELSHGVPIPMDVHVLLFTLGVGLCAGILAGVAPAWFACQTDPHTSLREGGRSETAGRGRQRARAGLVVAELALSLVLLVGAGLFLKSLSRLQEVQTGFQPHGVMSGALALPESQYAKPEQQIAFFQNLLQGLSGTPGVISAALGAPLPFSGSSWSASFSIEGRTPPPGDPGPHGNVRFVTPGYFATLGIPLREGRAFTDHDRQGTEPVVMIDENLARRYWPGEDPLGKRLRRGDRAPWARIVGIAAHIKHSELVGDSDKGVYYYPLLQQPEPDVFVVAKSAGNVGGLAGVIRESVHAVDANQPVHDLKSMDERVAASLGPRRFATTLLAIFAGISLLMAALGLYALISYTIAQRTHEIGIRMALGARGVEVLRLVLRQVMRLALTGLVLGAIAAFLLARLLSSQLFEVHAFDPATFVLMAAFLVCVALLAGFIPARRATQVDPIEALRYE
jgi:putative ABC transport system permease protein